MECAIKSTFVVIGGGIAGVSCAETLSFLCPDDSISLVTESTLIKTVTNLVPLGKALTKFDVEEKPLNSMNKHINIITDTLKHIDSIQKYIETNSGRRISFEYLCLCTGARPNLLHANDSRIIGIRDTDSVRSFQERLKNSTKVAIVGNGGIASELVYELDNIEIDWIVKDDHISATFVDAGAAKFFETSLKGKVSKEEPHVIKRMRYTNEESVSSKGHGAALGPDWHRNLNIKGKNKDTKKTVQIHYNTEIQEIKTSDYDQHRMEIILNNKMTIFCDLLVSAIGVKPTTTFSCDQNFKQGPDGGIFVNEMMETSISNIYAAGDVCYAGWAQAKQWFQMRLWTQARQMGSMAGKSMAAKYRKEEIYQDFCFELFGHVTTLFGYQVVLLGLYNAQGLANKYEMIVRITPGVEYIKYILVDGRLQGAILIGDTGLEETSENLILNEIDLSRFGDDILNPDIDIEDYFD